MKRFDLCICLPHLRFCKVTGNTRRVNWLQSQARRDEALQWSVDGRLALWQTITSPADLAQMFGAQLGANANMMQNDTALSRAASIAGSEYAAPVQVSPPETPAPRAYSLNGQPSQVDGCEWALPPQLTLPPSPSPTMPQLAPVTVQTPIGMASINPGRQPKYSNLCWALHNGLITQDQFDLATYGKLYRRCAELGYTQGCAPPADVATWIMQQQQAGTLPRLSVSDAELASIPHAPDMSNMGCAQALVAGGGLTGYAPPWSDALVTDSTAQMDNPDAGVGAWIADHPWLSLAIAVGGAVMLSRRAGR